MVIKGPGHQIQAIVDGVLSKHTVIWWDLECWSAGWERLKSLLLENKIGTQEAISMLTISKSVLWVMQGMQTKVSKAKACAWEAQSHSITGPLVLEGIFNC